MSSAQASERVASNTQEPVRVASRTTQQQQARARAELAPRDPWQRGPLQLVISLPDQRIAVYRGDRQIASSRVSTGKRGYRTPTGFFSILQKNRHHYSNLYAGAPMPFMQRVTWSGVALHAGRVPGYPASHGCIRLPYSFARKLFGMTEMNQHVVVTSKSLSAVKPGRTRHAGLFQPTPLSAITGYDIEVIEVAQLRDGEAMTVLPVRAPRLADTGEFRKASIHRQTVASLDETAIEQTVPRYETTEAAAAKMLDFEARVERYIDYTSRSDAPLRILITRETEREQGKEVQRLLNEIGIDAGPVDGVIGSMTRSAIRDFQAGIGMRETGTVTDDLLAELHRVSGTIPNENTGRLYVRREYKDIFNAPVDIARAGEPIGTHVFTAMEFGDHHARAGWTAMTLDDAGAAISAESALGRINIPEETRQRIADMLTPGSSLVITDNGISPRTGEYTDFIVETR